MSHTQSPIGVYDTVFHIDICYYHSKTHTLPPPILLPLQTGVRPSLQKVDERLRPANALVRSLLPHSLTVCCPAFAKLATEAKFIWARLRWVAWGRSVNLKTRIEGSYV